VGLVAGLETARGRAVDRLGDGRLRVETPGGVRRVAVRRPGEGVPAEADRVVRLGVDAGADRQESPDRRVSDVDDLHRELRYAVDRPTASRLVADHLDVDPTATGGSGAPGGRWSGPSVAVLAAVLCCLIGVGVVAGTAAVGDGWAPVDRSGGGDTTGAGAVTPVQPVAVGDAEAARDRGFGDTGGGAVVGEERSGAGVDPAPSVRGLDSGGVGDAWALSAAHRAALADRSYTLRVTYLAFENGSLVGRYTEVIQVEDGSHYRADVDGFGDYGPKPGSIAGADVYADGETRYVRNGGTVRTAPTITGAPFLPTTRRYLGRWLSVEWSAVVATEDGYEVRFAGDPHPAVTNVSGTAEVTEEGVIRSLRREYRRTGSERTGGGTQMMLTLRLSGVDNTTVERPEWVE